MCTVLFIDRERQKLRERKGEKRDREGERQKTITEKKGD